MMSARGPWTRRGAPKVVAVIASNREECLQEFLAAWTPVPWDETIVVEDGPRRSFALGGRSAGPIRHFSWEDIDADLEVVDPTTFSRCDSAIKLYGFWSAVRGGADVVIGLDDDCFPCGATEHFTASHLAALCPRARWIPSILDQPTRGFPYFDLGATDSAVANMGLWKGIADYDAPQTLALHRSGMLTASYQPPTGNWLVHPEHYWPWCAMNIAFCAEVAPLLYMPKMGQGSPFHRFDDIWCGVILQRCCRHLGLPLAAGEPHIRHVRASDPLVNLEKEASGIRANEQFWKVVDGAPLSKTEHTTPLRCAEAIAAHFARADRCDVGLAKNPALAAFLVDEGVRMSAWCRMFRRAGWD